jgi:hypothetical protein
VYVQFADRYLIIFLPFFILVSGIKIRKYLSKHSNLIIVIIIAISLPQILETKVLLAKSEAFWILGENSLKKGIDSKNISSEFWPWDANYDLKDYIEDISSKWYSTKFNPVKKYWSKWKKKKKSTRYFITERKEKTENGIIIGYITYKNYLFDEKSIYLIQRQFE